VNSATLVLHEVVVLLSCRHFSRL